VVSLKLVSPGAVGNGVTLYFFPQKRDDLLVIVLRLTTFSVIVTTRIPYPLPTDSFPTVLSKFIRKK